MTARKQRRSPKNGRQIKNNGTEIAIAVKKRIWRFLLKPKRVAL
jgi:hypothetical protein